MGRFRLRFSSAFFAALLAAASVCPASDSPASAPAAPPRGKVTLSPETTYFTSPLNPDGSVDYVAALNERLGRGITPANNAAVPLFETIGYKNDPELAAEFWKLLGAAPPTGWRSFLDLDLMTGNMACGGVDSTLTAAMSKAWRAQEHPLIDRWLRVPGNDRILLGVCMIRGMPQNYVPLMAGRVNGVRVMHKAEYIPCFWCIGICRALAARAMRSAAQGNVAAAEADIDSAHRVADLLWQGPFVISQMVAIACDAAANRAECGLACSGKLTAEQARGRIKAMQQLPAIPPLAQGLLGERLLNLDMVFYCRREGVGAFLKVMRPWILPKQPLPPEVAGQGAACADLDWDGILRRINKGHDELAQIVKEPSPAKREAMVRAASKREQPRMEWVSENEAAIKRAMAKPDSPEARATLTKLVETLLATDPAGPLVPAADMADKAAMRRRLAETAYALAAFRAERGAYPKALKELAPGYLPAVPVDVFSGEALRYRTIGGGYLLYSVGIETKDDAVAEKLAEKFGDLTVRVK